MCQIQVPLSTEMADMKVMTLHENVSRSPACMKVCELPIYTLSAFLWLSPVLARIMSIWQKTEGWWSSDSPRRRRSIPRWWWSSLVSFRLTNGYDWQFHKWYILLFNSRLFQTSGRSRSLARSMGKYSEHTDMKTNSDPSTSNNPY